MSSNGQSDLQQLLEEKTEENEKLKARNAALQYMVDQLKVDVRDLKEIVESKVSRCSHYVLLKPDNSLV